MDETVEEYFTDVNEKIIDGKCIDCEESGSIYEENGLCIKCYEANRGSLQNFKK